MRKMKKMKRLILFATLLIGIQVFSQSIINAPNEGTSSDSIVVVGPDRKAKHIPISSMVSLLPITGAINTGVTTGGEVTINVDPTKIDIAAGTGFIANWANPSSPTFITYSWDAYIGVDIPDLGLGFTDVCMVPSATPGIAEPLLTSGVEATPELKRIAIQLQSALHLNLTSVTIIGNSSIPSYQQVNSALDYIHRMGVINLANNYLENGANLQIDKTTGESIFPFINRINNPMNPTELTNTSISIVNMVKEYRDGVGGYTLAISTDIDPNFWDDGTGTLNSVSNNNFTVKRFYFFGQTNTTIVTYGQAEYNTFALAASAIISERPILDPVLHDATFTTALVVQQGSTDLAADVLGGNAEFVDVTNILSTGGGGQVGNFVTQDTDQLSGNTGNKTWESVWKFKNPSVSDDDIVTEVQNNVGVTTFSVTGTGAITNGTTQTNDAWAGTNLGYNNVLTATSSVGGVAGENSNVNGYASWFFGGDNDIDGNYIYGMGTNNVISGASAHGYGDFLTMTGEFSRALGVYLFTRALGETAVGHYNTDYTANSADSFDPLDRAFSVGVGILGTPADGLVILNNGNATFINDVGMVSSSIIETLGETVVAGDVLYLDTDGKYWLTDAIDETTSISELVIASESGVADDVIRVYTSGNLSGFTSLTVGARYYIEVGGGITDDRSSFSTGNISRYIGTAKSATELKFNPDGTYITIF